ncbi:copper amine oxidase N-terminal domain-containing protein, partial [Microbacteriaceae bacterium K1510]|nr:copper amine oxidase N-terminal domain-containing protein [Microbacteriaceae bacterium K1510]
LLMAPSAWASNYAQPVSGEVDGNIISFSQEDYVVMNGRILVPPEQVFSLLDAKYTWDGKTKTITAVRGSRKIVLTAGKARANVNGTIRKAMPSVQLIQSRPMVPLRLVSEALGGKVEW